MNHLISVNTNILYKKEEENYKKYFELVFLVDQPKYIRSNAGEIVRERGIEELRFIVAEDSFDAMIGILTKLRNAKEEELG
jgi:hypothetical protein